MRNHGIGLVLLVLLVSLPCISAAQDVDAQTFRPAVGPHSVFSLEHGRTLGHLEPTGGLVLEYVSRPVVQVFEDGEELPIVDQQLALHAIGGIGITEWLQFDLHLPLFLVNEVEFDETDRGGTALGDIGVRTKASFLNSQESTVGLGAMLDLRLPTGDDESFIGGGFAAVPRILFDVALADLRLVANVGADLRAARELRQTEVGSKLVWGVGAEYTLLRGLLVFGGEVFGSSEFNELFGREESPLEGLVGAKMITDAGFTVHGAAGAGITSGLGSPEFRTIVGISWAPRNLDFDNDGVNDTADRCPQEPEDRDGYQDSDGCPEDDNDADGIVDAEDQCPDEAEDADGFEDEDGCPELDNDGDGIKDSDDECPNEPGTQQTKGCPDSDSDGDGVKNLADKCPDEAEDKDGFEDADGCPDLDNDRDGIADADDKCPNKPGLAKDKGCPPAEQKVVREANRIKILDKVFFETGKSSIKPESNDLLSQVALVLRSNPDITKVEIGGHTDDRGSDAKNLELSQARAEAVKEFLVEQGIAASRLIAKGYGETMPVDVRTNKQARARNRRVEFNILEQAGVEPKVEESETGDKK